MSQWGESIRAGVAIVFAVLLVNSVGPAFAGETADIRQAAGGIALGDARDGIADRAFVLAPPNYRYVVARSPGSFVDCGEGSEPRRTNQSGRDTTSLTCAVTLTETIVIPAAAQSARLIVHY